jgi:cytochrome c oxidase subunit II
MTDVPLPYGAPSHVAAEVDSVFIFILVITAFFFITTQGALIYFAIKYRHRKGQPDVATSSTISNRVLEGIWIGVPSLAVAAIFFYGYTVWEDIRTVPQGAEEITVTARQWLYEFEYPDGRRTINEVRVPEGQTVKFNLTSADVLHGFYLPAFRIKQDAVPGRYTYVWLKAVKAGDYDIYCTQYCGVGHSQMRATLIVMPKAQYQQWYQQEIATAEKVLPLADRGKAVVIKLGCLACHSTDGSVKIGPTWKGLYGSKVTLSGGNTVTADGDYIRESILDPGAKIVKGFPNVMPTFKGIIKDDEITAVIAYLKTLSTAGQAEEKSEAKVSAPAPAAPPPSAKRGEELAQKSGCLACHTTDGSPKIGPTWKGLYESKVTLADGKVVTADDEYIEHHIFEPGKPPVKGYQPIMPSFKGTLTEDDVKSITEYIKTLK